MGDATIHDSDAKKQSYNMLRGVILYSPHHYYPDSGDGIIQETNLKNCTTRRKKFFFDGNEMKMGGENSPPVPGRHTNPIPNN
jgi:hypothetical protein